MALWEYYVATRDEVDLEEELIELGESIEYAGVRRALRTALLEIDRLAAAGKLERERERLRPLVGGVVADPRPALAFDASPVGVGMKNLRDGLESPDPEERLRFQRVAARWRARDLGEVQDELSLLKAPKRTGGRPGVSPPWRKVHDQMCRMRARVATGVPVIEAARAVAREEGAPGLAERARYLARLFEEKRALRE
ncbi:MAG: hypothetical protein HLUCCO18_08365 [Rhodobacteraceae bacterium HLUCCO18]|nr:MAG: hypothetical protein HLUCCO18_08365 [Rhodobacteraceae bacterium HLUCCO18]